MNLIILSFIVAIGFIAFGAGFLGGMFHHFVNNMYYNKKVKKLKRR